jgi:hypothetical protein
MDGKLYKFSSAKRSNGDDPANCVYTFNPKIENGLYKLHHSVFINSFYNINDTNNKIYFQESGGPLIIATLQNGYYNNSTIVTNIHTQMELVGNHNYTITLSPTTNKLTFVPNTGTLKFLFYNYTENSAKHILGFIGNSDDSSSITGDLPINLTDTLSYNIRLECNGIQNFIQDSSSNFYSFSVPILSNSLELTYHEPFNNQYVKFENPISDIRVKILNEESEQMTLYNDYYFVIQKVD